MPAEYSALGFESEEALVDALRARYRIPHDWGISIHLDVLDGEPVLTVLIRHGGRAHTVSDDERT